MWDVSSCVDRIKCARWVRRANDASPADGEGGAGMDSMQERKVVLSPLAYIAVSLALAHECNTITVSPALNDYRFLPPARSLAQSALFHIHVKH